MPRSFGMALADILAADLTAAVATGDNPVSAGVVGQMLAAGAALDSVLYGVFLVDQDLERVAVFVGWEDAHLFAP